MSGKFLKQSTAGQTRTIGPFVDDTDFKTAEDGLTIANTDIRLKKNGAADVAKNSGGGTADVNGQYAVTWDATDTDTVGELHYSVKVAGALQVFGTYTVLEEAIYDALFAASANAWSGAAGSSIGAANMTQLSGDAAAADNAEAFFDGTGYAGTNNVIPTVTTVTNQLTAAAIATGVWQDATAGDFTVASSIGKALYIANIAPGASGGHFISGSNSGTTTVGAWTVTGATTHTGAVQHSAGTTFTNSAGTGFTCSSTGGDGHGVAFSGNGFGDGFNSVGGATGSGCEFNGGLTSGTAVRFVAQGTNAIGLQIAGTGTAASLNISSSGGASVVVGGSTTLTGAVSLGSTLDVTGTTTLAALTTTGTATFNALTVSNATTLTGAVSLGSTLGVTGTTTLAALTTTGTVTLNALTVSNATTLSGAVSLGSTLGITGAFTSSNASNDIRGITVSTLDEDSATLDIDAAVRAAVGLASANLDTQLAAIAADNPNRPTRAVELANLIFTMVDATDFNTPETGVTVTATISKDGGAFAACTNAVSEISAGFYKITLTATEMTADSIALKFTGTGCAQRNFAFRTQPT